MGDKSDRGGYAPERLIDAIPDSIALIGCDGVIRTVNEGWRRLARENGLHELDKVCEGVSYTEVCSRAAREGVHDAQLALDGIRSVLDGTSKAFCLEYQMETPGRRHWYVMTVGLVGKIGALVQHADITDRKLAQVAITENERKLTALFDQAPVGAAVVSLDHRFMHVNQALCTMTGYTEQELKAFRFSDITHPEDRAEDLEGMSQLLQGTIDHFQIEKRYIRKDRTVRWVRKSASIIRDSEGNPSYFLPMMEDITAQKHAKDALEESEARLRSILDHSPAMIHIIDLEGRYVLINRTCERVLGVGNEAARGKSALEIYPEEIAAQFASNDRRAIESLTGFESEETIILEGGRHVFLSVQFPLLDAAGKPCAICGISSDITARKEAESKLQEAMKDVEKAHGDLLSVLNMLDLGIILINSKGMIEFLNLKALQLSGKGRMKVSGMRWDELFPWKPEDRDRLVGLIGGPEAKRETVQAQVDFGQGRRLWFSIKIQDDPLSPLRNIIILQDVTEINELRSLLDERSRFQGLVGRSGIMQQVYERIKDVSKVDWTVLIEGETGTGKELVARAIHASSHRKERPFLAVNCAGLTDSLLSSQLFGHRRGAFTGAVEDQKGFFEAANGGTLLLDEIGDISMSMQTSLLRVLEEKQVTRLGENKPRKLDVRILAATNRDLGAEAASGRFRLDLLYRLKVGRIKLPPLRERREDIPLLAHLFLKQSAASTGKPVKTAGEAAMQILLQYFWPGNVRELKSALEYATLHSRKDVIEPQDLPPEIVLIDSKNESLVEEPADEAAVILSALKRARGNRTRAAEELGMSRSTFYRRLFSLGIKSD